VNTNKIGRQHSLAALLFMGDKMKLPTPANDNVGHKLLTFNELKSVKMIWGERRGHGTMGAVQRLPMELTHVATFSF
jgi:hypothetical protein